MEIGIFMPDKQMKLRQDMNLIEFPFWSPDRKDKRSFYTIKTQEGLYTYKSLPNNVPDDVDVLFLYIILLKSQIQIQRDEGEDGLVVEFNAHNIIRATKNKKDDNKKRTLSKRDYERFEKALEKWSEVSALFKGNFYNVDTYTEKGKKVTVRNKIDKTFHVLKYKKIISDKERLKTRKYKKHDYIIKIDSDFLEIIEKSNFIKQIDINIFIALKKPTSRRLYEWLPKQFLNNKKSFTIRHNRFFADKMRITVPPYTSQILIKLKTFENSIKDINNYDKKYQYSMNYVLKEELDNKYFLITFNRKSIAKLLKESTTLNDNITPEENLIFEENDINIKSEEEKEISLKLQKLDFNDWQTFSQYLPTAEDWDLAFKDLAFEEKYYINDGKILKNPGGWLRKQITKNSKGESYESSPRYQKHIEEVEKKKVEEKLRIKEEAERKIKEELKEEKRKILNSLIDNKIKELANLYPKIFKDITNEAKIEVSKLISDYKAPYNEVVEVSKEKINSLSSKEMAKHLKKATNQISKEIDIDLSDSSEPILNAYKTSINNRMYQNIFDHYKLSSPSLIAYNKRVERETERVIRMLIRQKYFDQNDN